MPPTLVPGPAPPPAPPILFTYKFVREFRMLPFPLPRRLNKTSWCTKFMTNESDSREARRQTLIRLMFWCSRAHEYSRQASHIAWHPIFAECPPREWLLANRPSADIAHSMSDIRSDRDLNDAGVPLELLPPESWRRCEELAPPPVPPAPPAPPAAPAAKVAAKGAAKAKPKAKPKAKGTAAGAPKPKAKGKAKAKAMPVVPKAKPAPKGKAKAIADSARSHSTSSTSSEESKKSGSDRKASDSESQSQSDSS